MEHSVYYNESVENIVKQYFHKLRVRTTLGMLLVCLIAVMFYYLMNWMNYFLWGILIVPFYLLSLFLIFMGVKLLDFFCFTSLSKILYYDCDPVKYQKVLSQLLLLDKREKARKTISLELAAAAFAQGNVEAGGQYLKQVTLKKFDLFWKLKKLDCHADYCDLHDDFVGLYQIEKELKELKAVVKVKSYFHKEIEHRINLVEAMAVRGHESIDSQIKRWAMLYSIADTPLQENLYLMRLARLELIQGKREISMRYMGFVVAEGNALSCVNEAKQILSTYEAVNSNYSLDN